MRIAYFVLFFAFLWLPVLPVQAAGEDLPEEGHVFWTLMAALDRPDDADCNTVAQASPFSFSASQAISTCAQLAQMPTDMQTSMNEGAGESITTNLFDATNWHSVSNLYFQHASNGVADGRIAFTKVIDFMSRDFMLFMMNFGENMESDEGVLGLDADTVGGMKNYGAILTMYNVPDFDSPDILVDGAKDENDVVSNLVYNKAARTLTFNAVHFTVFEAVESDTVPSIASVNTKLHTTKTGEKVVRVAVKGKNFQKNAKVYLGSKKATKTLWRSEKKIIAYFPASELERWGKKKAYVKVINSNDVEDVHDSKVNILRLLASR